MLRESERELQRVVDEFYSVCVRRKLRVNVGKSKVMVFKRNEAEVVDMDRCKWRLFCHGHPLR